MHLNYTCHQNIFAVFNESGEEKQKKKKNTLYAVVFTIFFVSLVYLLVGVCGYLSYGSNVKSNIIQNFPTGSSFVYVSILQIFIAVMVILAYPLQCHPARISAINLIFNASEKLKKYQSRKKVVSDTMATSVDDFYFSSTEQQVIIITSKPSNESDKVITNKFKVITTDVGKHQLLQTKQEMESEEEKEKAGEKEEVVTDPEKDFFTVDLSEGQEIEPKKIGNNKVLINTAEVDLAKFEDNAYLYHGVTIAFLTLTFAIALLVEDLDVVFSFVGSTGSVLIAYILP
eukprot:Pgem_evm2s15182